MSALLSVRGVKTFYGRVMALKGVDLDVNEGEIVTLIGANGAGKSTLMMTIFGNPRCREGNIFFAGRAIATTWRPWWQVVLYAFILGGAVRFFHFALFQATFLTLHYFLVDSAVCLLFGATGFRAARAAQMVTQYRWLNERRGLLRWRRKPS